MPSSQHRPTDSHALSSSVPSSLSSTSLSSSFSSSLASDLAPPSNSSQSDIVAPDRSAASLPSSSKPRLFPHILSSAAPRSTPLANMGQPQSRPAPAPVPPRGLSPAPSSSPSTSGKLKRAFAGRRKKSEDITALFAGAAKAGKGGEYDSGSSHTPSPSSPSQAQPPPPLSRKGLALNIASNVFGGRKASGQKSPPVSPASPPAPTPPPKSFVLPPPIKSPVPPSTPPKDPRPSPPSVTVPHARPRPPPALLNHQNETGTASPEKAAPSPDKKEDWRKSDATMTSHVTIRPGALSGNRSPRPASLAESSHSANTIVPVNKRLSALLTDAEFTMVEESDVPTEESAASLPISGRPSPTGSLKTRNRRSASLNLGPVSVKPKAVTPDTTKPGASGRHSADNIPSTTPYSSSRDTPTLTRTAAAGIIAPVNATSASQTNGTNLRGRLAAWTAVTTTGSPGSVERPLPELPAPQPRRPPGSSHPPPVHPSFRHTAVSMTGSLAPAAGFAMGFGKRAVEKVGRAWGGLSSSSSSHSGYSSSSSVGAHSSSSAKHSDHASGYASSGPGGGHSHGVWRSKKRAPQMVSGASSASSMTSASSTSEDHASLNPQLGRCRRSPNHTHSGAPASGLVFRRDLQSCVRDTAIDEVRAKMSEPVEPYTGAKSIKPLEERWLPALATRCVQHILRWGVDEEGLFRISGRSSHIAKLRTAFDAGADYDMVECDPGDLDPHAVSSIFKTFLRELPQPILTSALLSYFEQALTSDPRDAAPEEKSPVKSRSPPSLRKPPSLSTLAMPAFAGARSLSEAQVRTMAWLISQLPREHRDLLYTVVELIKLTAARHKETKMPLGNLMLVFCPTLNMTPTLLRALCEEEGIWAGPPPPEGIEKPVGVVKDASVPEVTVVGDEPRDEYDDIIVIGRIVDDSELLTPRSVGEQSDSARVSPDDGASFVSAMEPPSNGPTRSPSPAGSGSGSQIPPLSSSDSLDTQSSISELVSPEPAPIDQPVGKKGIAASNDSLNIPEPLDLSLPASSLVTDAIISHSPVPFPSSGGGSTPHTPLTQRKPAAVLTYPRSDPASEPRRVKRPSLHLLFSKKSSTSLNCPPSAGISAPLATSRTYGSGTSPLPTATSNGSSMRSPPLVHLASSPPKLETAISSSPILLFSDASSPTSIRSQIEGPMIDRSKSAPLEKAMGASDPGLGALTLDTRTESSGSSLFSTPRQTPIADFYRSRSTSLFFPDDTPAPTATQGDEPEPRASHTRTVTEPSASHVKKAAEAFPSKPKTLAAHSRANSHASESPSISLDVQASEQDDWSASVLLLATQSSTS